MIPYHRVDFELSTGTLDVFFAGCTVGCKGCHNIELWDSRGNTRSDLKEKIDNPLVKTVRFMGGEPLEQEGIRGLCEYLADKTVWLFTSYSEPEWSHLVDYVKCGPYREDLPSWYCKELDITLASTNQYIIDNKEDKIYEAT